jgi:hypothetical protein
MISSLHVNKSPGRVREQYKGEIDMVERVECLNAVAEDRHADTDEGNGNVSFDRVSFAWFDY